MLTEFAQDNFVDDGMCVDCCIHDTDGHNPHAHIMLTIRPLAENGKWQSKTEKEYLCIKDGEEKGFTAPEFKTAQSSGWEKQYQYFVGKRKMYMPPSIADEQKLERASKYPKNTKYGIQNPVSERWNSEAQLTLWREKWADISNKYLEMVQAESRIDHRSNKERGIDEQPTIHEGVSSRMTENKGFTSERCETNRQIKEDNILLREIKAQLKKLLKAVLNTIPALADTLETIRKNVMIFTYNIFRTRHDKEDTYEKVIKKRFKIEKYTDIIEKLKSKTDEKNSAKQKKSETPIYSVLKHRELSQKISQLSEEIEELRTEKNMLLKSIGCDKDSDISAFKKSIPNMEKQLDTLEKQEIKYSAELDNALNEFFEVKNQAVDVDVDEYELINERLSIRPQKLQEFYDYVNEHYGKQFNPVGLSDTVFGVDKQLNENLEFERRSIERALKRYKSQQEQADNSKHSLHRDDDELEL